MSSVARFRVRPAAVPGSAQRLWRDRPRLVALGLLAVIAVAASLLQSSSATILQQTLDQNWRGSYDILVTQRGKDPVTAGLLRLDSLVDATGGRLSMADLAAIRSLPDVAVAAPVAQVSFPGGLAPSFDPRLWLPVPVRHDASLEHPQAFRITVSSTIDDGAEKRSLATQTVLAFAYQPSYSQLVFAPNGSPLLDENGQPVYATHELADSPRLLSGDNRVRFAAGDFDTGTGTIPLGLTVDPRPAATVTLVDPVAERELLGDAGDFLDPLIGRDATPGVIPVVALDRQPTPINATVKVEEFDDVTPGVGGAEAVALAQGTGFLQNGQIAPTIEKDSATTVVGQYSVDLSTGVQPFANSLLLLGGVSQSTADKSGAHPSSGTSPRSILGGQYTVPEDAKTDGKGVGLAARGYASFGLYTAAPLSRGAPTGSVTDYSKLFGAVGSSLIEKRFEVVGNYRPEEVRAKAGETSFAPLGGYDTVNPSLVADASGAEIAARPLATSITGFGIPGTNDMAVASFDILKDWNVERPISAIRIRVAGIDAYTPAAQQKLLAVASELGTLGFAATIVSGSSPQAISVLVSGYATAATDASGAQIVGDLGHIDQDWSRLGAVTEVDAAISATSVALLVVTVVAVGVLLAVVQLGSVPERRAQAGVLRELGWRRRRIVGWFLSVDAVALFLLAVVGAVAVTLATVPAVASLSVGASLALVVATSGVAAVAGARAPRSRARARVASRRASIIGPISFGARLARTGPAHSVSLALAVLLITVSIALAAAVFVQGRQLAGPTLLGAVASARGWLPQGVLAAASLAAGISLAVLSRRMGLERRREQWRAIRAMGWSTAEVTRAQAAELAFSAVPGALAGVALAAGIAVQEPGILAPVLASSGLGAALAVVVVLVSGRKLD